MTKPATKVTFVRLPLDYYREVAKMAKEQDRTITNMLMVLVKSALDEIKGRADKKD